MFPNVEKAKSRFGLRPYEAWRKRQGWQGQDYSIEEDRAAKGWLESGYERALRIKSLSDRLEKLEHEVRHWKKQDVDVDELATDVENFKDKIQKKADSPRFEYNKLLKELESLKKKYGVIATRLSDPHITPDFTNKYNKRVEKKQDEVREMFRPFTYFPGDNQIKIDKPSPILVDKNTLNSTMRTADKMYTKFIPNQKRTLGRLKSRIDKLEAFVKHYDEDTEEIINKPGKFFIQATSHRSREKLKSSGIKFKGYASMQDDYHFLEIDLKDKEKALAIKGIRKASKPKGVLLNEWK